VHIFNVDKIKLRFFTKKKQIAANTYELPYKNSMLPNVRTARKSVATVATRAARKQASLLCLRPVTIGSYVAPKRDPFA
jgi:hypothetical protein